MPDIRLENGQIVKNFPDNPTQDDLAKLDRIKQKYNITPKENIPKKEVSQLESAIRGGAQGLSFGLSDEATAFLRNIAGKTPLLPEKPYEQALEESRQAYKQAQEANPITYTGSEIAGGVLPVLIPTGATQATAGASLGRLAAIGAGTGALSGLGYSEGETAGRIAKDIAIGGALGGALPVLGRGIQSAIQGVKPAIDTGIKSMITAATGKGSQYLEKLERNPEQIKRIEKIFTESAPEEVSKLSNELTNLVEKDPFAKKAQLYSKNAYKVLDNEKNNIKVNRDSIFEYLNNKASNLSKSISEIDQSTSGDLFKKANDIQKFFPEIMDGRETKKLIQQIDKDIKALKPGQGKQLPINSQNKLDELRELRQVIDSDLKTQSPNYAEAMKPVAEATNVSNYLDRLKSTVFGGKQADPKLARNYIENKLATGKKNINLLPEENKTINLLESELQRKKYNNISGIDKFRNLTQTINDLNLYKEMQSTGAIGSNITNRYLATIGGGMAGMGGTIGTSMGGLPGGIVGTGIGASIGYPLAATLGAKAEKEGGKIAQKLLEKTKGIRTPTAIPEPTQRGFATQQGLQRGILDQFLSDNASEVKRKQEMKSKSKFESDNPTRVKPK